MSQQASEAVRATQGPEEAPAEGRRKRLAEAPRPPQVALVLDEARKPRVD